MRESRGPALHYRENLRFWKAIGKRVVGSAEALSRVVTPGKHRCALR